MGKRWCCSDCGLIFGDLAAILNTWQKIPKNISYINCVLILRGHIKYTYLTEIRIDIEIAWA